MLRTLAALGLIYRLAIAATATFGTWSEANCQGDYLAVTVPEGCGTDSDLPIFKSAGKSNDVPADEWTGTVTLLYGSNGCEELEEPETLTSNDICVNVLDGDGQVADCLEVSYSA